MPARPLALALAIALLGASGARAQAPLAVDGWRPTDAVIALWPMPDEASRTRARLLVEGLVEVWLAEREVTLIGALDPSERRGGEDLAAFLDCMRAEDRDHLAEAAQRASACAREHPFGRRLHPGFRLLTPGHLGPEDRAFLQSVDPGTHSPAPWLASVARDEVDGTTLFAIVSGDPPPLEADGFADQVVLDVGAGRWDDARLGALLLSACQAAAVEARRCALRARGERYGLYLRSDRAALVREGDDGAQLEVVEAQTDAVDGTVDARLAVVSRDDWALPLHAPRIEGPDPVDVGEAHRVRVTVPLEADESVPSTLVTPRAALDDAPLDVDAPDPWQLTVEVPPFDAPGPHRLAVWLEGADGREGRRAERTFDVVEVRPPLDLPAGTRACRPFERPTAPLRGELRISGASCFLQPWWSLESVDHDLLSPRDAPRARLVVRAHASALPFAILAGVALLIGLTAWIATFRPGARWMAVARERGATFRDAAEVEWEVRPLGSVDGVIEVVRLGPLAYGVTPEGDRVRLREGAAIVQDGRRRAQLLDHATATALRDGLMSEPPLSSIRRGGFGSRTALLVGTPALAIAPALLFAETGPAAVAMAIAGLTVVLALLVSGAAERSW